MDRRHDSRTTIFSPGGRLFQVEYAMEVVAHAGACLGICAKDGVVLAAQLRCPHDLLDREKFPDKLHKIDEHICCAFAGLGGDANILAAEMRVIATRHRHVYKNPVPIQQMVSYTCDVKQAYSQQAGHRPFGVSTLYMGWDESKSFQLFQSDPSGNYTQWNATCIGNKCVPAIDLLLKELKTKYGKSTTPGAATLNLDEAMLVAIRVLAMTLDSKITADKIEMATTKRIINVNGDYQVKVHMLTTAEIADVIKKHHDFSEQSTSKQCKKK